MLAACYAPIDFAGFAWVVLTPLLAAVWFAPRWAKSDGLRIFSLGWTTGFIYFFGCFHWLITVSIAGWIPLAAYLAVYPGLWALFIGTAARPRDVLEVENSPWLNSWHNLRVAILASAAWVASEWLRGVVFSGFGWNTLGVALHGNVALVQIADVTGVGGISFMLVMVNVIIVATFKRFQVEFRRHRFRPHYDFSLTVALVALVFGYGVRELFAPAQPMEVLNVAAVQTNVPLVTRRDPAQEEQILQLHQRLTENAIAMKPDLIIWPEAATPEPLFHDQHTLDTVRSLAGQFDGDLLLGTVHFASPVEAYNSVALLTEHGKTAQLYHKIHLVPYGEYLPLRAYVPYPEFIVSQIPDDFNFGKEPVILQMDSKPVKIAPLICFEDTLGDLARHFVQKGAQIFINVTNDGWFLHSAGSVQHLNNAVLRCAETKIPMVRAANTGVTCVVDRFGRVRQRLEDEKGNTFMQGILRVPVDIPKTPLLTFYTRYGEVFSYACIGLTFVGLGVRFARKKQ